MAIQQPAPFRIFPRAGERNITRADVVGQRPPRLTDLYYLMVAASWPSTLLLITVAFLAINAVFGLLFLWVGGVSHARAGSFGDAFFFSVETFATIGYGEMAPQSVGAHLLVTLDVVVGMVAVALATGLVFAKFSRPKARIIFTDVAVMTPRNGELHFMFRMANERSNHVVEARLKLALLSTEVTAEGERIRKMSDLALVRSESPAFVLTWTAMHRIDRSSPLYGATPESLREIGAEVIVVFTGMDGTLQQTLHARHSYLPHEILWDMRLADMLRQDESGRRIVDYTQFHCVVPMVGAASAPATSP